MSDGYCVAETCAERTQPAEGALSRQSRHHCLHSKPNAEHDMAGSVFYLAPVDNASGKIFGKKQKWMAVRRLTGKRQRGCSVTGERTTAVTEKEQTWRTQFAQIAQMTRARLEDPAFMASDQAAFAKQSKHKTLRAFVFDICKEELLNGK